ncbi:RNA polymerase factor sigma-54 [Salimicrobium halophilum]|uniref:RNA polymerase, sigma 54 subunit, RpoN/SigL n=1 Tax=Salimicrobium halophilum TaxID=86666 RepID=A0A1G8UA96_9BACI|nr:RNA polymerase factor sigma-54 [Salimicrobium halophilum]SDJ50659.1 RNA polymerase, sigma 54 subunit, RpoN/SigL [Salimicrobium halophilum]
MELALSQKQVQHLNMTPSLQQAIHLLQLSSIELKEYIEKESLENPWIDLKEPSFSSVGANQQGAAPLFQGNQKPDLHQHLQQQATFLPLPEEEKNIVTHLILHLNENGYLEETLDQIAHDYNISECSAERSLSHVQNLDPAGVGARTLKECLLLQASRYYPENEKLSRLISDHLEKTAGGEREYLCSKLSITTEELNDCLANLKSLHPKPGLQVGATNSSPLMPDVYIKEQEGAYSVSLNHQLVPKLELNQDYKRLMNEYKEAFAYLQEKYKKFTWLQKSIEQRQSTILAITQSILHHQPRMPAEGIGSLSPLTRKQVADELEIHESTVSRAVRNKIVTTPAGTYFMEELFPSSTTNGSSSAVIKHRIHQLVTKENPSSPLSDQKLVQSLGKEGLHVSRRTVAKYRDSLHILPSSKRKKAPIPH